MADKQPDVWALILDSERSLTSTTESRRRKLALSPIAQREFLPNLDRRGALIEPSLMATLRGLCEGQLDWPWFLYGAAGLGKTYAGLWLCDYTRGLYLTAPGLAETVIEAQQGRLCSSDHAPGRSYDVTVPMFWDKVQRRPVVVLDELGSRDKVTDHQYECVKRMLDLREGKPFVAISNKDVKTLAALYDDRVASRLVAGTVTRIQGQDRRVKRG